MDEVYGRSLAGGARSDRFVAYAEAAARGARVHGYNPGTSKPVRDTIRALIAINAEDLLASIANEVAGRLGYHSDELLHFTVATPGMWTDRVGTEVEHHLLAKDPCGVLWWFDEPVSGDAVESAIASQAARLVIHRRAERPATLAAAVRQEGLAGVMGKRPGRFDTDAAAALDVLGNDASLATVVAFLYGDDAARAMGFTPIGLRDRVGLDHAIAIASTDESGRRHTNA